MDDGFGSDVDVYVDDESAPATPLPAASPARWAGPSSSITSPQLGALPMPASEAEAGAATSRDRDSVRRDKERLQRFANEAGRFLDAAYDNDEGVIVQDGREEGRETVDDFKARRRVELDKARLERFSREADAFIDAAYGEDSSGFVEEEALSPRSTSEGLGGISASAGAAGAAAAVVEREKKRLERFHTEAMSFLDASVDVGGGGMEGLGDGSGGNVSSRAPGGLAMAKPSRRDLGLVDDNMVARVEKDKEQLEMHYRDAMAFLERAEAGEGIIEERELETGELDRVRLKTYAAEAMNFLENAFAGDGGDARMAGSGTGEDDTGSGGGRAMMDDGLSPHSRATERNAIVSNVIDGLNDTAAVARKRRLGTVGAEAWQIAEDRRAMERYYEEDDTFDGNAVVEENLGGPGSDGASGGAGLSKDSIINDGEDDWGGQDVSTDDGSEKGPDESGKRSGRLSLGQTGGMRSGHDGAGGGPSSVDGRALFRVNSCIDSDDDEVSIFESAREAFNANDSKALAEQQLSLNDVIFPVGVQPANHKLSSSSLSPVPTSMKSLPTGVASGRRRTEDRSTSVGDGAMNNADGPPSNGPRSSPARFNIPPSPLPDDDCLVGLLMEDGAGSNPEWSDVPLSKSFYRSVPRGATIKLRGRPSTRNLDDAAGASVDATSSAAGAASDGSTAAIVRIEQERDVLMKNLEVIINERSQMAAQISEMKKTFMATFGRSKSIEQETSGAEVDVVADLTEAYHEFTLVVKESEATVNVLEGHIAEGQKRIQELEAEQESLHARIASLERKLEDRGAREIALRATAGDEASMELRRELSIVKSEAREEQIIAERRRREADAETDRVKSEMRRIEELLSIETDLRRDAERKVAVSAEDMKSLHRELTDLKALLIGEEKQTKRKLQDADAELKKVRSELSRVEDAVGKEDEARIELSRVEALLIEERKARTVAEERADEAERKKSTAASVALGGGGSTGSSRMWEQMAAAREEADEARKGQERAERQLKEYHSSSHSIGVRNLGSGATDNGMVSQLESQLELAKRHRESEVAEQRAEIERLQIALKQSEPSGVESKAERELKAEMSELELKISEDRGTMRSLEVERNAALGAKRHADQEARHLRRTLETRLGASSGSEVTSLQAELHGLREEMDMRERQLFVQVEDSTSLLSSCEGQISILRKEIIEVQLQGERALEAERRSRRNTESQLAKMEQEVKAARRIASRGFAKSEASRDRDSSAVASGSVDGGTGLVKSLSKRGFGLGRKSKAGKKEKEKEAAAAAAASSTGSEKKKSRSRKD